MAITKPTPSDAVLKARELILLALENADSDALQHLIVLQEMIRSLNFVRLLEEIKKRGAKESQP